MTDKYYEPSDEHPRPIWIDGDGGCVLIDANKNFDPKTMTRATPADISRMWRRLWQDATPKQVQAITAMEFDNPSAQLARQAQ